ncbi:nucleoside triphosphate pyrophosphohydrolase family protein [Paraliobacillus ryukyuensis]|uniref:nucleoside triphosphate pyrophosphohydrolase family protein n=1 Tax=Paraliobacillus ryukyuensis TaxID=200904 RepID=UPI0009A7A0E2|nr:nucleoside triphosphate pyrophosphohydrolase family protein [Paraliobacillus ryukyuensis]
MQLNEFQELSKRTLPNRDMRKDSANYALGLTGESGEVADEIKKWLFHGHGIDRMAIKKELGDTLHYIAGLCSILGFELEGVAQENIEKLKKRYPDGFSQEASINRVE